MSAIDELIRHFARHVSLPWQRDIPSDYRVWMLHYDKALERRVQARLDDLAAATRQNGHGWATYDLSALVAPWFAAHEFFEGLVQQPEELPGLLPEFEAKLTADLTAKLGNHGEQEVLAIVGGGALFGLLRLSALIPQVAPAIRGRLLVLFPGRHDNGVYRLLDARDGWSYRATPIPA